MNQQFFQFIISNFFFLKETNKPEWSKKELKGLVYYMALYNENPDWPTHKHVPFWDKCAKAVSEFSGMPPTTG